MYLLCLFMILKVKIYIRIVIWNVCNVWSDLAWINPKRISTMMAMVSRDVNLTLFKKYRNWKFLFTTMSITRKWKISEPYYITFEYSQIPPIDLFAMYVSFVIMRCTRYRKKGKIYRVWKVVLRILGDFVQTIVKTAEREDSICMGRGKNTDFTTWSILVFYGWENTRNAERKDILYLSN